MYKMFAAMRIEWVVMMAVILAGCGRETPVPLPEPDEPERPGVETPVEEARGFYFSEANPTAIVADGDAVDFELIVLRRNSSAEAHLRIASQGARTTEALFAAGQTQAAVAVNIDVRDIEAGHSKVYDFSINSEDRADEGAGSWSVRVSRPAMPADDAIKAVYRLGGHNYEVTLKVSDIEGGRHILVEGEDFSRSIYHVGGKVRVESPAMAPMGYVSCRSAADEAARLRAEGRWVDYAFETEPTFTADEQRYNMLFAYEDAERVVVPAAEYLLMGSTSQWTDCGEASYVDGWFLPWVSYNASYYLPQENPWQIWLQHRADNPLRLRIIDQFRSTSPLSCANEAALGLATEILLLADGTATMAAQTSPFQNRDLFPLGVDIKAGDIRWEVSASGDTIIRIGSPLYRAIGAEQWRRQPGAYEAIIRYGSIEH